MALFDDTRADWGARKPQAPIYTVPIASRTEKFAHWNGGALGITAAKDHATCLAAVKAIQAEHMHNDPAHNWADIGYNGLICPAHARLIEGRGRDAVGAHCPNHNRTGIAVQFMLGKGETATPAMFARARRFFDDCETAARHTLKPMGHRDGYATECPGDQIEAWVKAGMPGTQEDEVTPQDIKDIAAAVWTYPGLVPGRSVWGEVVTGTNRSQTAVDGIKALAATLPADAAKAVLEALDKSYDATVQLTPKEN